MKIFKRLFKYMKPNKEIGIYIRTNKLSDKKNPMEFIFLDEITSKDIKKYKQKGIKQVRWIASYGTRTCKKCRTLNKKIFNIDRVPKKPHKDCRCCLVVHKKK